MIPLIIIRIDRTAMTDIPTSLQQQYSLQEILSANTGCEMLLGINLFEFTNELSRRGGTLDQETIQAFMALARLSHQKDNPPHHHNEHLDD